MSAVKDIPFASEASGLDELAGPAPYFTNALADRAGVIRARPGITAWGDFPASPPSTGPVTMIQSFGNYLIYTTDDGSVFAWRGAGDVVSLSVTGGDSMVDGDLRPMAAASGTIFVIVAGGAPQKVTSGLVCDRLGGDPPDASGVVIISRRIVISGVDSGLQYWSGILDSGFETWDIGIEFEEAEAKADNLVTVSTAAAELFSFGTDTVEVFVPDATATFAPVAAVEAGLIAPRSVVRWHNVHAWFDDRKQLVMSDCHSFDASSIISGDIQNVLDGLTTVDDTWAFRLKLGQHDCLVWVLPTEGRVFALDMTTKTWSQWNGWTAGRLGGWRPTAFFYWKERGLHLVGLADGTIAQLSFGAHTDLGDPIRWRARTGFVDHGVSQPKVPLQAHLQFRRGEATSDESAIEVTWRDNLGPFVAPLRYSLGTAGSDGVTEPTVEITPAGAPYKQRQWEVSSTAEDAIALVKARETVDILEVG